MTRINFDLFDAGPAPAGEKQGNTQRHESASGLFGKMVDWKMVQAGTRPGDGNTGEGRNSGRRAGGCQTAPASGNAGMAAVAGHGAKTGAVFGKSDSADRAERSLDPQRFGGKQAVRRGECVPPAQMQTILESDPELSGMVGEACAALEQAGLAALLQAVEEQHANEDDVSVQYAGHLSVPVFNDSARDGGQIESSGSVLSSVRQAAPIAPDQAGLSATVHAAPVRNGQSVLQTLVCNNAAIEKTQNAGPAHEQIASAQQAGRAEAGVASRLLDQAEFDVAGIESRQDGLAASAPGQGNVGDTSVVAAAAVDAKLGGAELQSEVGSAPTNSFPAETPIVLQAALKPQTSMAASEIAQAGERVAASAQKQLFLENAAQIQIRPMSAHPDDIAVGRAEAVPDASPSQTVPELEMRAADVLEHETRTGAELELDPVRNATTEEGRILTARGEPEIGLSGTRLAARQSALTESNLKGFGAERGQTRQDTEVAQAQAVRVDFDSLRSKGQGLAQVQGNLHSDRGQSARFTGSQTSYPADQAEKEQNLAKAEAHRANSADAKTETEQAAEPDVAETKLKDTFKVVVQNAFEHDPLARTNLVADAHAVRQTTASANAVVQPTAASERAPALAERVERFTELISRFDEHVIKLVSKDDDRSMTIQLIPPNLGKVALSCREEAGELKVQLVAETAVVRNLLQEQEPALRQMLEQAGFRLSHFDVRSQGDRPSPQQSRRGQDSTGKRMKVSAIKVEPEPDESVQYRRPGSADTVWYIA